MEKLSGPSPPKPEHTAEGGASGASSSSPRVSLEPVASTPKPKINIKKATPQVVAGNPFTQLGLQPSNGASCLPVSTASTAGVPKRARAEPDEQSTIRPPQKTMKSTGDEPIDVYENRILEQIFRIKLEESTRQEDARHKFTFLSKLRAELIAENEPVRFSVRNLDSAILEAASSIPHNKPVLDYLLPCWKRISKAQKSVKGNVKKDTILKEAQRLCMSNCVFAVTMPELFRLVMYMTSSETY